VSTLAQKGFGNELELLEAVQAKAGLELWYDK
jgi:hypothetical protein